MTLEKKLGFLKYFFSYNLQFTLKENVGKVIEIIFYAKIPRRDILWAPTVDLSGPHIVAVEISASYVEKCDLHDSLNKVETILLGTSSLHPKT